MAAADAEGSTPPSGPSPASQARMREQQGVAHQLADVMVR